VDKPREAMPAVVSAHSVTPHDDVAAVGTPLAVGGRGLSLVDCPSLVPMGRLRSRSVFAFDRHVGGQGFELPGT
jgi:hypothetical protein